MTQQTFCDELERVEKKLSAMARSIAQLQNTLELLKAAAQHLEPLPEISASIIPDAHTSSRVFAVKPYLDALGVLRAAFEEKRRTKKLKPIPRYMAGFDPTYSDGGRFERSIARDIEKGYDVSRFLDKREEALRDWGNGNRIVDTSPSQIEKVNQAVAHLRNPEGRKA